MGSKLHFATPTLVARPVPETNRHPGHGLHPSFETRHRCRMKILLVEDNDTDLWLFQEAFSALRIPHDLEVARDGERALVRLRDGRLT
jgi:hypothetical protein